MNYAAIYERLIDRARNRKHPGYTERHHILPRCMGGDDARSNIVRLTAEEHFVAHQLLTKIHPEIPQLVFALLAMTRNPLGQRYNNKLFGWMRRAIAVELSKLNLGRKRSAETREKNRQRQLARETTPDIVDNMRRAQAQRWIDHTKRPDPKQHIDKRFSFQGSDMTIAEISEISGVGTKLLRKRLCERGWSVDRAVQSSLKKTAEPKQKTPKPAKFSPPDQPKIDKRRRPQTPEHRAKRSAALKGKKHTAEHNAAVSAANKGRKSPMEGRQHTAETKEKMRLATMNQAGLTEAGHRLAALKASMTPEQRSAMARKAWETKHAKLMASFVGDELNA